MNAQPPHCLDCEQIVLDAFYSINRIAESVSTPAKNTAEMLLMSARMLTIFHLTSATCLTARCHCAGCSCRGSLAPHQQQITTPAPTLHQFCLNFFKNLIKSNHPHPQHLPTRMVSLSTTTSHATATTAAASVSTPPREKMCCSA